MRARLLHLSPLATSLLLNFALGFTSLLTAQTPEPASAKPEPTAAPTPGKPARNRSNKAATLPKDDAKTKDAPKVVASDAAKSDAAKKDDDKLKPALSADTLAGLEFRNIGPAVASGRVIAFAVNPKARSEFYVGVASGGVWKTVNDGTTWSPVFENEGSYSIGWVTLDPNDPSVVWVGTGEANSQRSVGYGDGVYRSDDGGKSWTNMGLKKSEHIGRIVIDPRHSNVVYVAAEGPLWSAGGDRGLYKSEDGGKTWKAVLTISENTGVDDVALDPANPDILYASSYQRRRHMWTLIDGGPESAIYKSTDAGVTWNKLKSGLPGVDMGRIGLAVSPVDTNVVYATVEAAEGKGGIFRSTDKGATWEKRNSFDNGAMYYGQVIPDPKNVDRIYVGSVVMRVSDDGGKTLHGLNEKNRHGDNHTIWIDPTDSRHYLIGCDGGVYESWDRADTWSYKQNLPTLQFYDVALDNAAPFYNVYGGTQDYFSWGGPSRTKSAAGIVNSDWFVITGGDGFHQAVDPVDPNTVYGESQHAGIVRYDRRTGSELFIQPQPGRGETGWRWNWDTPIVISPHSHTRIYLAANKVFRSDDRGDSWQAISGDLTRQIDRNQLPVMGKVWGADAVAKNQSTSLYGNIIAMSESPRKEGLLYIGTDDGLIQTTSDNGAHWTKYDTFPTVPDKTFVSRIVASNHAEGTVYATFGNHKNADFKPYVLKSTDYGKSWTAITGDLPENGPVWAFAEDPVTPELLFVGTEFGVFASFEGGKKWIQLKGGLPTISVRDIAIHPREHDLVIATFGRGFYVLDDISSLRAIASAGATDGNGALDKPSQLFAVKDALLYIPRRPQGGNGKSYQGDSFFTASNPPFGAVFTYYRKDKLKSLKDHRKDAEKEADKKKEAGHYPTNDELRAEAEEEPPASFFVIYDESGKAVRQLDASSDKGLHRTAWNLRYALPDTSDEQHGDGEGEGDGPNTPLAMPGRYSAKLFQRVSGRVTEVAGSVNFNIVTDNADEIPEADRMALHNFQQQIVKLWRVTAGTTASAHDVQSRLKAVKRALKEVPGAYAALSARADELITRMSAITRELDGDNVLRARSENTPPSLNDRVGFVIEASRFAIGKPTGTQQQQYAIASQDLAEQLAKLRQVMLTDLPALERDMEAAGAPWTPGRVPEWKVE